MTSKHILGVGVDLVELTDIRRVKNKDRFAEFFLTPKERRAVPKGATETQFLASRFAAKEAIIKAFPGTLKPLDFSIQKNGHKPQVVFRRDSNNKKYLVQISITHTGRTAGAIALISAL